MKKLVTVMLAMSLIITGTVTSVFAETLDIAVNVKPSKVQELKVSSNYNSLKLTWNTVESAESYHVYRATSKSGSFKHIKTVTNVAYTNTGLTCGKTYYYKVRAVNSKGKGSYSSVVYGKTRLAKANITKITLPKEAQVRVYWDKVSGASGYQVYRKRTDKSTWKLFRTVSNKYTYMTDKLLGNKEEPWGKGNGIDYDYEDMEHSWDYKVRAYKTVSGKKVYGSFSASEKWVPDWTIEEIYEELWKYGESLEFPVYEVLVEPNEDGEYLVPKTDGSIYHVKHVTGWNSSITGNDEGVFTNPANGNTIKKSTYIKHTPKNSNWSTMWPILLHPYMSKKSILEDAKDKMKYNLGSITSANPYAWDPDWNQWMGGTDFSVYYEKYLNGYKVWMLW